MRLTYGHSWKWQIPSMQTGWHPGNIMTRELKGLAEKGYIEQPFIPEYAKHNAHMYYIKVKDQEERAKLIDFLHERGVHTVFHYVPLHSAPAGRKFGRFHGEDRYTTKKVNGFCVFHVLSTFRKRPGACSCFYKGIL